MRTRDEVNDERQGTLMMGVSYGAVRLVTTTLDSGHPGRPPSQKNSNGISRLRNDGGMSATTAKGYNCALEGWKREKLK